MKTQAARRWLLFSLVAALVAAPASAQVLRLKADIPFEFVAGQKTLSAGQYDVNPLNPSTWLIRSMDSTAATFILTRGSGKKAANDRPRLVFHRYGDTYFLAEIWGNADNGRILPVSKREKEMSRGAMPTKLAVLLTPDIH